MPHHTVKPGECLATIGRDHGIRWQKIYDHPDNAEFRKERPNPHVVNPGDRVFVPELKRRDEMPNERSNK